VITIFRQLNFQSQDKTPQPRLPFLERIFGRGAHPLSYQRQTTTHNLEKSWLSFFNKESRGRQAMNLTRRGLVFAAAVFASARDSKANVLDKGRPIRVIVPRDPGGSVDIVGRGWSDGVRLLGCQSFVENVGGGGGRIGTGMVVRASADGYTLLIGSTSEIVLSPLVEGGSFDPIAELTPIGILSTSPLVICGDPSLPVRDLHELIAYSKANPDKLNFGSAGTGTIGHIEGELLKQVIDLQGLTHVPYRGGAAAILDVMGGRLTLRSSRSHPASCRCTVPGS
jgi:tripartite-type tricarboxylate transporter receptor subunit TctC